jgi:hypothetical protein
LGDDLLRERYAGFASAVSGIVPHVRGFAARVIE